MHTNTAVKFFCVIFSILITIAAVSPAPYSDYDNINDLYELLLQQEKLNDELGRHQVERRARGPQLRLRFGKRAGSFDPVMKPIPVERAPSLRLRFGKRSEESPISDYLSGLSSEGAN
ncbi:uncharacterized protein [Leptinotarsa decemlineata]|uniref:uncharacterized protein n=1 Tax=Leptinotarsa decemlineata TaxID=7539 RepID=UPI000C252386|nr:short neuropeptide F-like [Leptinotarsa decemlineata]QZZ63293.1 short neuropeptide F-like protein [Leptinotarsa decemlineata]